MGSYAKQYEITTAQEMVQCIATLPKSVEGTFDLHIINLSASPANIALWTSFTEGTDIDMSGIWELDTTMQTGDNLVYSGKPFAAGQSLYIKITPGIIDTDTTLSIQFTGHTY